MSNDYEFDDDEPVVSKKKKGSKNKPTKLKKVKKVKKAVSDDSSSKKSKKDKETKPVKDKSSEKKVSKRGRPAKKSSSKAAKATSSAYVPPKISSKADKLAYLTENLKRNFLASWLESNKTALEKGKDFKAVKATDDASFFTNTFNEMFMAYRKTHKGSTNKVISAAMSTSNANGYSALDSFVNSLSK